MKTKRILILPVLFAMVATTGCSTIVNHGRPAGVDVTSDPPGAEIFLDGRPTGARTPARIELAGGSAEHAIRVEKPGYGTFERTIAKEMDPWVWGNATFAVFPIVAAAGFGIDAWCGQWYRVEPAEIEVSLRASGSAAPAAVKQPAPTARPKPRESARPSNRAPASVPENAAVRRETRPAPAASSAPVATPDETPEPEPEASRPDLDEILQDILDDNH